jgi:hypothetical protein
MKYSLELLLKGMVSIHMEVFNSNFITMHSNTSSST